MRLIDVLVVRAVDPRGRSPQRCDFSRIEFPRLAACGVANPLQLTGMFNAAKDAFTSKAAQTYINQRIVRYGEVQTLKIDSRNKTMEMCCHLIGEPTPVTVKVENYALREADGKKLLRVGACLCSRPWLQNLLNDLARNREIPVPGWAAAAL